MLAAVLTSLVATAPAPVAWINPHAVPARLAVPPNGDREPKSSPPNRSEPWRYPNTGDSDR